MLPGSGFLIENLLAAGPGRTIPGFYLTAASAEIDAILTKLIVQNIAQDTPEYFRWPR